MTYRTLVSTVGAWLWTAAAPALPFSAICTFMIFADLISARRLARRLGRAVPGKRDRLKFSSARFKRLIDTLIRTYLLLIMAAMIQTCILGEVFPLLKFAAGAVCFWQAVSILENEAACNGARWAKLARKVLVDKTSRYLGVPLDEFL